MALPFLTVGIGASAGGLAAFQGFLAAMPADSGMAFVLVQHLDPTHKSLLAELLRKATAMSVLEAKDGMKVAKNTVYVIPPNATLEIRKGALQVTKPAPKRERRHPIDTFFISLAEDQGECAVCIVLSGAGSDGSLGLRAIKEQGGFILAQSGADHSIMLGMPKSAIETGLVDVVMPVQEMPAKLMHYQAHLDDVKQHKDADGTRHDLPGHLSHICALLQRQTGHDFSKYKERTLLRRIQRRMQLAQIDSVADYMALIGEDSRERDLLFRDFLIGVTQFFRDPAAFETLATRLPRLLEGRSTDRPLRAWVVGCATGEEAYSIAIVLKETLAQQELDCPLQVFGTDLDNHAIEIARHARYPRAIDTSISPARLARWFVKTGDDYTVAKTIREACVFSVHNVLKDPPFSRLDLISCRNLLIYLDAAVQSRVLRAFHYALMPEGYLFLGPSETIARHTNLYGVLDKKHRLFQRLGTTASLPQFPLTTSRGSGTATGMTMPRPEAPVDRMAHHAMAKFGPAFVIVDGRDEIVRFSGQTGKYLEPSPGTASLNLFALVRHELRAAVRAALQKARSQGQLVEQANLAIKINGTSAFTTLNVEPLAEREGVPAHCIIVFRDQSTVVASGKSPNKTAKATDRLVRDLEDELQALRTQLNTTGSDLELSNEQLTSANEEFQSVNEELQSTNEELETAKEELQSINEELQTINAELAAKNEWLARANSDLQNFLNSTEIAVLFLDAELRIRAFTPAMTELLHLRDSDRGRPVTDLVTRLSYRDLAKDSQQVIRTASTIEREVHIPEGEGMSFIMRIRPYRSIDNVTDGVILTFIDISARKQHERAQAQLLAVIESSTDAIYTTTLDEVIGSWNSGAERIFGYRSEEIVGQALSKLIPEQCRLEREKALQRLREGEQLASFDTERLHKDGHTIPASVTVSAVRDEAGTIVAWSTIARDITERKRDEAQRQLLMRELDHRVKNLLSVISAVASLTMHSTDSKEAFAQAFSGRLRALADAHSMLRKTGWQGTALIDVVRAQLAIYTNQTGSNILVEGNDVLLTPHATMTLALAFHELATNAAKYGALSVSTGSVKVKISRAPGVPHPRVIVHWSESGGPPVATPVRRGFGTTIVERSLKEDLDAKVRRTFAAEGVQCILEFPLSHTIGSLGKSETNKPAPA